VTFAQLRCFAAVARLGSVRAAAAELAITEAAVSDALGALRRDLGDELVVRRDGAMTLTTGGRRLAGTAAEILALADRARREIGEAKGERTLLRVAATGSVSEHVADPLLDAFTRRMPSLEVSAAVERPAAFSELLLTRRADVTLGPRPGGQAAQAIDSVPFLRYRMAVVAAPGHPLAQRHDIPFGLLARERWLTGPSATEPGEPTAELLGRLGLEGPEVRVFSSEAAALAAVAAGDGVALAVLHAVIGGLRQGSLARLDVRGTPIPGLWFASALGPDRRTPAASALRSFVTTPEATHAMLDRSTGVPAARRRPAVHITLWS
jgi:DNA-binding transcriptional LysR family regulator